MPSNRVRLSIHQPSPTTVSYTVSTASSRAKYPSFFLHHALYALRICLGLATLLCVAVKLNGPQIPYIEVSSTYLEAVSWPRLGAVSLLSIFLVFRRYHTEESLLVLRTLGIQTRTLSSSYLLASSVRFIPTSQIRDIFIHEAFKGFEVRYYLAVVVEGESEVVVVFPNLLPNRKILEEVWKGARQCLYEPKK